MLVGTSLLVSRFVQLTYSSPLLHGTSKLSIFLWLKLGGNREAAARLSMPDLRTQR